MLVTVAGGLLRLVDLGAFPEVLADEGLWTNSTKNQVAFGDWFMDGRSHVLLSPLFHLACWPVFALFGPSIAAARWVSALAGTAAIPLTGLLVGRLTRRRDVAFAAALLFAVGQGFVWTARLALVEAFQLLWLLAAAVALARPSARGVLAGGALFALALLAKSSSLFLLPILALWLAWPADPRRGWIDAPALARAAIFVLLALGLAGAVYAGLYLAQPERFVAAHRVELEAEFAEALSRPLVSLGRFGFDPLQGARSLHALFADAPFLWVLASLGVLVVAVSGGRGSALLAAWLVLGTGFVLVQRYQPLRYFHLNAPALAGCAALALAALLPAARSGRRLRAAALGLVVLFELGFFAANLASNPARILRQVTDWAETVPADARVLAAGYLCTDLPQRAYAWYHLADDAPGLLAAIAALEVDYVLFDHQEWPAEWRPVLDAHFTRVAEWPFGIAYRVEPDR